MHALFEGIYENEETGGDRYIHCVVKQYCLYLIE